MGNTLKLDVSFFLPCKRSHISDEVPNFLVAKLKPKGRHEAGLPHGFTPTLNNVEEVLVRLFWSDLGEIGDRDRRLGHLLGPVPPFALGAVAEHAFLHVQLSPLLGVAPRLGQERNNQEENEKEG